MAASPPLHTLTGNLLCERTLDFSTWSVGRTQRAVREEFNTRGKGVNVSNLLARLGTRSTALIFAGGAPGAEAEAWLQARGLDYVAFPTAASSRTGTVIWSESQAETTFLGPDAPPDGPALLAAANWLDARPDGEVLALCGSFPGWDTVAYAPLRAALVRWQERGRLLADVYGPPLRALLNQSVELVKINRQEFDGLFPAAEHAASLEQRLIDLRAKAQVRNWVVSDGPNAVWVLAESGTPVRMTPPTIREVSPTGSGDVLFGAMIHARFRLDLALEDAVRFALPFAASNAAHKGVADFELPLRE
ncbi:MAG: PfkB family carbohydrate kinase [Cephaloticoccus sp.]